MMTEFSQAVCERIGYYVYILKDPRNNLNFYVGKGKGNRIFQHIPRKGFKSRTDVKKKYKET
jgi:uncharacterized protein